MPLGEAMEEIVFNSNGKAKTMDLAKAWLRASLEGLNPSSLPYRSS